MEAFIPLAEHVCYRRYNSVAIDFDKKLKHIELPLLRKIGPPAALVCFTRQTDE